MRDLRKHLQLADRHIAEAKRLIAEQLVRLNDMIVRGDDTREAEKLLGAFLDSLAAFEAHQRVVLAELKSEIHVSEIGNIREAGVATNKPYGDNARKGAVKKRSQLKGKTMGKTTFTKRDKRDGEFMAQKKTTKFKGVRKER